MDKMFKTIQIQTIFGCNRRCIFCPNVDFKGPIIPMNDAIFYDIIKQLKELKFKGRISPYLQNEPLLDKRISEFVRLTRRECTRSTILISTNGDLLNREVMARLFDCGLNILLINCYDNEKQYEQIDNFVSSFVKRKKNIIKDNRVNVYKVYNYKKKIIQIRRLFGLIAPDWTNRSGNVPGAKKILRPLSLFCPKPFEQLYVNYRGEALLCCNDYKFKVVMGDVIKKRIINIWKNDIYVQYRESLKKRNRNIFLCDSCDFDYRANYNFKYF